MGRNRYKTTDPQQSYCITMTPYKSAEDMRSHAGAWERNQLIPKELLRNKLNEMYQLLGVEL